MHACMHQNVKVRYVMSNVRRFEQKGLVYVRGYKTDERQTPFQEGYLITWLDSSKPREMAIEEAIQRTDKALDGRFSTSPFMERVHRIRDMIIEHSKHACRFFISRYSSWSLLVSSTESFSWRTTSAGPPP